MGEIKRHALDVGPYGSGWIEFDRGLEILNKRTRQKGYGWAGTLSMEQPKRQGLITFTDYTTASYPAYF